MPTSLKKGSNVRNVRLSVGAKIYSILGMCFVGFAAIALSQLRQLGDGLEDQKKMELQHLTSVALQIVKDEYAAAHRGLQTEEEARKRAAERMSTMRYGTDDYFWISDLYAHVVMHPIKPELNGKDASNIKDPDGKALFVEFANVVKQNGSGFVAYQWPKPGLDTAQPKLSYVVGFEPWGWVIGTGVYIDDLNNQVWASARQILGLGLAIAVATLLACAYVAGRMTRSIAEVSNALQGLATGQEVQINCSQRQDEIGDIARSYLKLKSDIALSLRLKQMVDGMPIGVMTADAGNNWTIDYINPAFKEIFEPVKSLLPVPAGSITGHSIDIFHKNPARQRSILNDAANYPMSTTVVFGERKFALNLSAIQDGRGKVTGAMVSWQDVTKMQTLADRFEKQIQSIVETVTQSSAELQQHASRTTGIAGQTEKQAADGMESMTAASASVQSVASGAQELLSSINEISRQVTHSNATASQAVENAQRAGNIMRSLDNAAQKIGEIVDLIGTIAGQTNLLALNATIEAARAGEAGRGFAVVASEVKALATQTGKATEEIVSQVQGIQQSSRDAVNAIGSITSIIENLSETSAAIAAAVDQQSASTNEIARNAQQTSGGTNDALRTIVQVSEASKQNGEAARGILNSADGLAIQARKLKDEVARFLAEIRAA